MRTTLYYEETLKDNILYYRIASDAQWQIKPAVLKEAHARIEELERDKTNAAATIADLKDKVRKLKRQKKEVVSQACKMLESKMSEADTRLKYVEDGQKAMVAAYDRLRQGE